MSTATQRYVAVCTFSSINASQTVSGATDQITTTASRTGPGLASRERLNAAKAQIDARLAREAAASAADDQITTTSSR